MKTDKNINLIALASMVMVLFLILISSTASASITETRITTNKSDSEYPSIQGNNIVWDDSRNGGSKDTYGNYVRNWDIYMYNLSTKKETQITTNKSIQYFPDVYGSRVVWSDRRNDAMNGEEIRLLDLSTKKETIIAVGDTQCPAIYGNLVLWMSLQPDWHVNVYDLSSKKHTDLTQLGLIVSSFDVYGNRIVWGEQDMGVSNIYMYDLSTSQKTQITTSGTAWDPAIYGNRILWQDKRNGNWDIYMYDLSTKKEIQITTNKSDSGNPSIYGNSIVWEDNRNGNWDIYAYDLVTRQQIHTTDKSDQITPAIYNNKIVWTDYRNGNPDIYMGTINYLPVAAFTASPASGKAPLTVKFADKSVDAYYWSWNFGDGTTSKDQNPVHKYTKTGKYTVTLTVKNAAGSNTKTMSGYLTVSKK